MGLTVFINFENIKLTIYQISKEASINPGIFDILKYSNSSIKNTKKAINTCNMDSDVNAVEQKDYKDNIPYT